MGIGCQIRTATREPSAGSTGAILFLCLTLLIGMAGCASPRQETTELIQQAGWTAGTMDAGPFVLYAAHRRGFTPGKPLRVYIEGDGFAWVNRYRLSDDPTPRRPVALELALRDAAPNVVYLARPCQYVTGTQRRNCHSDYWSTARYAQPVVMASSAAIDRLMAESGADKLELFGFSGGGTVALLLAAQRTDIRQVVTIAGVLDPDTWTELDGVTPLAHSLNPINFVNRLASVPQRHFVGVKDDVVPLAVARAYAARFPANAVPEISVIQGQGHECCWADIWPELLTGRIGP